MKTDSLRTVGVDLIIVVAWFGVVSFAWGIAGWPSSAYYLVVFGGILGFSLAGEPWGKSNR